MNNNINWAQIKQALKENFIEQDFQQYATTAFLGVDFDKGLEVFRYILEQKLPYHDETTLVFDKLQLYAKGHQNKDILKGLVVGYEPFLKKIFHTKGNSFPAGTTLRWGYDSFFTYLSILHNDKYRFFEQSIINGVKTATHPSINFLNLLSDTTTFGESLHSLYHLRNSDLHNDPSIDTRKISDYITHCLKSYFYFTFKYYNELVAAIPPDELISIQTLTIRNLASLSGGSYNPVIQNEIKRDDIIQTIETKLQDLDVLFIEGDQGMGKTTILHQFVSKHSNNCFAYFIDSKDSNTYSNLAILQALSNQLCFKIKQDTFEELYGNQFYDEDFLKNYFSTNYNQLISNKNSTQTFYFIIDGLDEISMDKQNEIKEQILDKLPYDKPNIKLLLSRIQNKDFVRYSCKYDKLGISFLLRDQSYILFGNNHTPEQFDDINRLCKNNAGKIVFFRDLINIIGIDSIIDKLSSDMKDIYQYLWNNYTDSNNNSVEKSNLLLAILAFNDKKYNAANIAKLLGIKENEVIDLISPIPFIRKNLRGSYEYIFEGFANFAKTKLSTYKNKIDKIIIEYLLSDLSSVDSLIDLPEIYKETGNKDGLMTLLTNERWKQLLVSSEKISVVSRVSNIALETIQDESENKYIPTLLKYSVLKSALKELSRTTVWQYEIAASLVLEDYIVAGNLANIAFLKEDKLKMFASIARAYTERKEKVPDKIQRKIQDLYDDIDASKDFKNIKESAVEIASLLMYSNPKLAFRLIEDLSGTISDNDNAFDWALAQISLSIHSNIENLEDVSKEDINTKVYSKIRNPKIKEFAAAILYLSENQTAEQIIEKIN